MSKLKLILAAVLTAVGGFAAAAASAQTDVAGDCIYAEYRASNGACMGATTRLCQGPPECKVSPT